MQPPWGSSRQPGDKGRGGNEAGYGHRGQGAPRGSVVNGASGHVEMGKKSLRQHSEGFLLQTNAEMPPR